MRICFVNPPGEYYSAISGGAISTIVMESARELLEKGHDVRIATQISQDEPYKVGEIAPLILPDRHAMPLPSRAVSALRRRLMRWDIPGFEFYLGAVVEALAEWNPEAVILFNDLVSPAPLRKALPRAKIAVWLQNEWRANRRHLLATRAAGTRLLACSEYIRRWTSIEHQIPVHEIAVIPSGVNLATFHPSREPGPCEETLRVLFLGRIDPNKGPDVVADAVAELQREGCRVELTVAGALWWYGHGREMENPYFRRLRAKMDAMEAATYLGHVARPWVPGLLREHDVVCVLSRSNEPFALVTLEAMASGCAVVSSGRGGLLESCGGAASLADPDDVETVKRVLRALAEDRALLRRQKALALKRAARAPWAESVRLLEGALA